MRRVSISSLLLLLITSGIYLFTRTSDYYWDGITFAQQIETVAQHQQEYWRLFHQNHLLYNLLGYLVYIAAVKFGLAVRALTILQVINTILAGISVALVASIALQLTGNQRASIIAALAMAGSVSWWQIATDANAYQLSILLMLICARLLINEKPALMLASLSFAAAMLIHQLASLFYPAIIILLLLTTPRQLRLRAVMQLSLLAGGVTLIIYYACAKICLPTGNNDLISIMRWTVSNQSNVNLSNDWQTGLKFLLRGNLDLIFGHSLTLFCSQPTIVESVTVVIGLVALIIGLSLLIKFLRSQRSFSSSDECCSGNRFSVRQGLIFVGVWTVPYLGFLICWQPWLPFYRVFYLPALALALALALSKMDRLLEATTGKLAIGALILTLFCINFALQIGLHMRITANPLIATANNLQTRWNDQTVIYYRDQTQADVAFQYFNPTVQWRKFTPQTMTELNHEISNIYQRGGTIWLNHGALAILSSSDQHQFDISKDQISITVPGDHACYQQLLPPPQGN